MRPNSKDVALCAVFTALASWAPVSGAQNTPDPADPAVGVPAASYRSAFEGYRKMGDETVADWRASNDAVAKAGGWRAYAREAQAPEEKPTEIKGAIVPSAPAGPAPIGNGMPGHGMHGGHALPGGRQ